MSSWLDNKRDVAVDSILSYIAPRLFLAFAAAVLIALAITSPVYIASVAGLIFVLVRWHTRKKMPQRPSEKFGTVQRDRMLVAGHSRTSSSDAKSSSPHKALITIRPVGRWAAALHPLQRLPSRP
jgi:hypothetical protein